MPKYNSIDTIKARIFFKILDTKDYQLLKPKPREKGLEQVFMSIYDEFFIHSENNEAKQYLELSKKIAELQYKISNLKRALHFYYYNKTTKEMRLGFIEALKNGYDIEINPNESFSSEVLRVLNIDLGVLENELTIAEDEFKQLTSKTQQKISSYESKIVAVENVLKRSIDDDITLAKYIELEKSARQIISEQQRQQQGKKAA